MLQVVVALWIIVSGVQSVENSAAGDSTEIMTKIVTKHCTKKYSISCLKLEAVRLVDRLSLTPAYRLLPGVSLVHTNYTLLSSLPEEVLGPLVSGDDSALDSLLAARVSEYLNSLTLSVKLLDSGTVNSARTLSERILKNKDDHATGRGRVGGGAALIGAGTMAAVGMAGLAAVAGKAMMTSMLALMLAAGGAMRGGGGGGGGGGGKDCSYAFAAGRRSITVQEGPVYKHP